MIEIKKMQPDDKGKYPYTGYVDCAVKTLIAGGPLKFYTMSRYFSFAFVLFFKLLLLLLLLFILLTINIINLKFIFEGILNFIYCSWQMLCIFCNQVDKWDKHR